MQLIAAKFAQSGRHATYTTTLDTNGSTGSKNIVNVDIAVRYL
jgi:hypothetical protein